MQSFLTPSSVPERPGLVLGLAMALGGGMGHATRWNLWRGQAQTVFDRRHIPWDCSIGSSGDALHRMPATHGR